MEEFAAVAGADSPQDLVRALHERLDAQPGSLHQSDDVTLIVLHAGPRQFVQAERPVPALHESPLEVFRRSAA
jgi:hypothetical protein